MRNYVVILAAVAALLTGGLPASAAGGWAVTYLDPVPGALAPGTSYTIGFWVLQHGVHPFEGDLGTTGLTLTDAKGRPTTFAGTPLPEAGHYATAVSLPKGTYTIEGVQGIFAPYEVGTLTVPGGIEIRPVPPELRDAGATEQDHWGAIRPPGFPAGKGTPAQTSAAPASAPAAAPTAAQVAAEQESATAVQERVAGQEGGGFPPYTLLLAAVGGALFTLLAVRLARRRREPDPSEPSGRSSGETSEGLSDGGGDGRSGGEGDVVVFNG
ncbi:hypothetical protein [Nonomuraea glycinis]|uniref:hypothetical protein n=1 Tax=Nonomuraea glycinis TaxID=2047744 RepID=UPI002E12E29D|nr:hypothetical protein OHA68_43645 [Nonomuraea glycinis]